MEWLDMEADAVPEKVTISHRGARYEIGRGKRYYGIWASDMPGSDPVDRWPETPDGWAQAWTRFVSLETPETITAVEQRGFTFPRIPLPRMKGMAAGNAAAAAGALLGLGIALGVAGLFPGYFGGQGGHSLASDASQLVPHLCYLAGWAVSAALIGLGARRGQAGRGWARAGALLGTGLSAVTLGMFLSDLGQAVSGTPAAGAGAGLVLGIAGWAACAAGSAAGLAVRGSGPGKPVRPRPEHAGPVALLVLGALGTVAAFAPAWDTYTLQSAGGTQTITAGNAFSFPGVVITGNVIIMIAVVAVALAAALWRPARQGAALLAGAIIPMATQAISALIQVSQPATPAQFGISQSQASAAGLTISSGVTPAFWVYCVFVIALAISCAWLLTEPALPAASGHVAGPWAGAATPGGDENSDENRQSIPGQSDHGQSDDADSRARDSDGGPEGGEPEDDGAENSYA